MINFNINGKIYESRSLNSLSITEFNELYEFIETEKNPKNLSEGLLHFFTDIPLELIYKLDDSIYEIDWKLKLSEEIKSSAIKEKYLGKKLLNFDEIEFGTFIDVDFHLTNPNNESRIQNVVAGLLLAIDNEDGQSISEFGNIVKDKMLVGDALLIYQRFNEWRTERFIQYGSLVGIKPEGEEEDEGDEFEVPEGVEPPPLEEEEEVKPDKWGWIGAAFELSKLGVFGVLDDVLKQKFGTILNFMLYEKEKNDEEIARMKRENIRNR